MIISLELLDNAAGIRHAFFTRRGGVSGGLFESLNCGFGSGDGADNVIRNRAIAMEQLGVEADRLLTCYQIHGTSVVTVEKAWSRETAPQADGMVTRVPGIALGILTADCAPILFHDPVARAIGAAHGGWRGALAGIVEATVERMEAIGAERTRICVAIGPCIAATSYEVGPEFRLRFVASDSAAALYFSPAPRTGHFMFDLAGYLEHRFARAGIAAVQRASHDTVVEEETFFSYRRACLRAEVHYGRGLSAIVLGD